MKENQDILDTVKWRFTAALLFGVKFHDILNFVYDYEGLIDVNISMDRFFRDNYSLGSRFLIVFSVLLNLT